MSDPVSSASSCRPLRGWIMQPAHVGRLSAGDPLGQKAYITPHLPDGILTSELKRASADVQQATVLCWFEINFRPFSGTDEHGQVLKATSVPGGAYGTAHYGHAAYGGASGRSLFTPRGSVLGSDEIKAEFNGVISPELLTTIGSALDRAGNQPDGVPFLWEVIPLLGRTDYTSYVVSQGDFVTNLMGERIGVVDREGIEAAILLRIAAIEKLIDAPAVRHGQIGHNNPPEAPMSVLDYQTIKLKTLQLRELINDQNINAEEIKSTAVELVPTKSRIGDWLKERLTVFSDAFSKTAGSGLGVIFVGWIGEEIQKEVHLFYLIDEVIRLVGQL